MCGKLIKHGDPTIRLFLCRTWLCKSNLADDNGNYSSYTTIY